MNNTTPISGAGLIEAVDGKIQGIRTRSLDRLGFKHDTFEADEGAIHELVERRHKIAHGVERAGLEQATYDKVRTAVFGIMGRLVRMVFDGLQEERYRKKNEELALTP